MALKSKTLKKTLEQIAEDNVRVTKGTSKNQEVIKNGVPNDHHRKQENSDTVVGINIGLTKNMDNYESLRVDCWLTDKVASDETIEQAYSRVTKIVNDTLERIIDTVLEDN